MWSQIWPILALALIVTSSIVGTGWVVWVLCGESLDPDKLKRDNKGRRRSDQ
jgi:NhaP-type Na+/H+ or K+/H+ antiporter